MRLLRNLLWILLLIFLMQMQETAQKSLYRRNKNVKKSHAQQLNKHSRPFLRKRTALSFEEPQMEQWEIIKPFDFELEGRKNLKNSEQNEEILAEEFAMQKPIVVKDVMLKTDASFSSALENELSIHKLMEELVAKSQLIGVADEEQIAFEAFKSNEKDLGKDISSEHGLSKGILENENTDDNDKVNEIKMEISNATSNTELLDIANNLKDQTHAIQIDKNNKTMLEEMFKKAIMQHYWQQLLQKAKDMEEHKKEVQVNNSKKKELNKVVLRNKEKEIASTENESNFDKVDSELSNGNESEIEKLKNEISDLELREYQNVPKNVTEDALGNSENVLAAAKKSQLSNTKDNNDTQTLPGKVENSMEFLKNLTYENDAPVQSEDNLQPNWTVATTTADHKMINQTMDIQDRSNAIIRILYKEDLQTKDASNNSSQNPPFNLTTVTSVPHPEDIVAMLLDDEILKKQLDFLQQNAPNIKQHKEVLHNQHELFTKGVLAKNNTELEADFKKAALNAQLIILGEKLKNVLDLNKNNLTSYQMDVENGGQTLELPHYIDLLGEEIAVSEKTVEQQSMYPSTEIGNSSKETVPIQESNDLITAYPGEETDLDVEKVMPSISPLSSIELMTDEIGIKETTTIGAIIEENQTVVNSVKESSKESLEKEVETTTATVLVLRNETIPPTETFKEEKIILPLEQQMKEGVISSKENIENGIETPQKVDEIGNENDIKADHTIQMNDRPENPTKMVEGNLKATEEIENSESKDKASFEETKENLNKTENFKEEENNKEDMKNLSTVAENLEKKNVEKIKEDQSSFENAMNAEKINVELKKDEINTSIDDIVHETNITVLPSKEENIKTQIKNVKETYTPLPKIELKEENVTSKEEEKLTEEIKDFNDKLKRKENLIVTKNETITKVEEGDDKELRKQSIKETTTETTEKEEGVKEFTSDHEYNINNKDREESITNDKVKMGNKETPFGIFHKTGEIVKANISVEEGLNATSFVIGHAGLEKDDTKESSDVSQDKNILNVKDDISGEDYDDAETSAEINDDDAEGNIEESFDLNDEEIIKYELMINETTNKNSAEVNVENEKVYGEKFKNSSTEEATEEISANDGYQLHKNNLKKAEIKNKIEEDVDNSKIKSNFTVESLIVDNGEIELNNVKENALKETDEVETVLSDTLSNEEKSQSKEELIVELKNNSGHKAENFGGPLKAIEKVNLSQKTVNIEGININLENDELGHKEDSEPMEVKVENFEEPPKVPESQNSSEESIKTENNKDSFLIEEKENIPGKIVAINNHKNEEFEVNSEKNKLEDSEKSSIEENIKINDDLGGMSTIMEQYQNKKDIIDDVVYKADNHKIEDQNLKESLLDEEKENISHDVIDTQDEKIKLKNEKTHYVDTENVKLEPNIEKEATEENKKGGMSISKKENKHEEKITDDKNNRIKVEKNEESSTYVPKENISQEIVRTKVDQTKELEQKLADEILKVKTANINEEKNMEMLNGTEDKDKTQLKEENYQNTKSNTAEEDSDKNENEKKIEVKKPTIKNNETKIKNTDDFVKENDEIMNENKIMKVNLDNLNKSTKVITSENHKMKLEHLKEKPEHTDKRKEVTTEIELSIDDQMQAGEKTQKQAIVENNESEKVTTVEISKLKQEENKENVALTESKYKDINKLSSAKEEISIEGNMDNVEKLSAMEIEKLKTTSSGEKIVENEKSKIVENVQTLQKIIKKNNLMKQNPQIPDDNKNIQYIQFENKNHGKSTEQRNETYKLKNEDTKEDKQPIFYFLLDGEQSNSKDKSEVVINNNKPEEKVTDLRDGNIGVEKLKQTGTNRTLKNVSELEENYEPLLIIIKKGHNTDIHEIKEYNGESEKEEVQELKNLAYHKELNMQINKDLDKEMDEQRMRININKKLNSFEDKKINLENVNRNETNIIQFNKETEDENSMKIKNSNAVRKLVQQTNKSSINDNTNRMSNTKPTVATTNGMDIDEADENIQNIESRLTAIKTGPIKKTIAVLNKQKEDRDEQIHKNNNESKAQVIKEEMAYNDDDYYSLIIAPTENDKVVEKESDENFKNDEKDIIDSKEIENSQLDNLQFSNVAIKNPIPKDELINTQSTEENKQNQINKIIKKSFFRSDTNTNGLHDNMAVAVATVANLMDKISDNNANDISEIQEKRKISLTNPSSSLTPSSSSSSSIQLNAVEAPNIKETDIVADNDEGDDDGDTNNAFDVVALIGYPDTTPYHAGKHIQNIAEFDEQQQPISNWWSTLHHAEIRKFLNSIFNDATTDEFYQEISRQARAELQDITQSRNKQQMGSTHRQQQQQQWLSNIWSLL